MGESKVSVKLINVGEKEVLIKYLKNRILLRTADEILKFARINEIKIQSHQQKKVEVIKLLNEHQMIDVVEDKVYAVVIAYKLPNELKTVPDMKNYARERGLSINNKFKRENLKNLLLKIGYAEEEYGKLYKKQGSYRRFLKLRKDIVDFTRSYYLYEGGKNTNIPVIIELLLKNKLVDFIEGIVFEKEPPIDPITPELMEFIAINNGSESILGRHLGELSFFRKKYSKFAAVIMFMICLHLLAQPICFDREDK